MNKIINHIYLCALIIGFCISPLLAVAKDNYYITGQVGVAKPINKINLIEEDLANGPIIKHKLKNCFIKIN